MAKRQRLLSKSGGCGLVLATCLVACSLLIVNGVLVTMAYEWLLPSLPDFFIQPRVAQTIYFAGPVVLLLIELWLLDFLTGGAYRVKESDGAKN